MIPQFCTIHPVLRIKLRRITVRISRTRYCLSINGQAKRYDGLWLVNEHSDLHFLLYNFSEQTFPFKLDDLETNSAKGKKFPQTPLPDDANYELQSHDSWNVQSRCRIKLRDFSQIIYQIVPYARDPLPVNFFLNVSLNTPTSSYLKCT